MLKNIQKQIDLKIFDIATTMIDQVSDNIGKENDKNLKKININKRSFTAGFKAFKKTIQLITFI